MAITPLPEGANLENLKKRAKTLLKAVRAGDSRALDQVGPFFGDPRAISLTQAQLVIARRYGFSSWTKLKRHVESTTDETGDQLANRFLDLVTVAYGPVPDFGPKRFEQAAELLARHPEIAGQSIYTAAAAGDVDEVERWLGQSPELVNTSGGFFDWPPLMYAAYARLPGRSSLEVGLRLLQHGADPNAHYMWGGQYRFTVLTGVFGHGEGGPVNQPEHPDHEQFARALLAHGADPNDSQVAYNRCFNPDNGWLELLLEHGLAPSDQNNWLVKNEDSLSPHPSTTMSFLLIHAIKNGYTRRVQLLTDQGVDLERPDDTYDTQTKGRTPNEVAMICGRGAIAEKLLQAGAKRRDLSPLDQLQVACMAGDLEHVQEILRKTPDLLERAYPYDTLCQAIRSGNHAALRTMIAVGFDVNAQRANTPLHQAAFQGDVEMIDMLLEAGADPTLRDADHYQTPLGWALYAEEEAAIARLERAPMDIFSAAARGITAQIQTLLEEDPTRLNQRFKEIRPQGKPSPADWMTPLCNAAFANQAGAVALLLEKGAERSISTDDGVALLALVKDHAKEEIVRLLTS